MELNEFYEKYPNNTEQLNSGKQFTYRYYKNSSAKATLLLLTGGIGLSDLFYLHFERFAKEFSVLTFDYQIQFVDNKEFAQAVAELLNKLNEKVWLVGQSLGGIVAQIIARNYPDVVEGMVLYKKLIKWAIMKKKTEGFTEDEKALMEGQPDLRYDDSCCSDEYYQRTPGIAY